MIYNAFARDHINGHLQHYWWICSHTACNIFAAPLVKEAFGLSETEEEMVQNFEPGDAILISENVHVSLHFYATEEKDKLFTTKPSEIDTSLFSTDTEPESQTDNKRNRNGDKK